LAALSLRLSKSLRSRRKWLAQLKYEPDEEDDDDDDDDDGRSLVAVAVAVAVAVVSLVSSEAVSDCREATRCSRPPRSQMSSE
jgi:hypothetical protein